MRVIISGSFDPITRGHLDLVARCQQLFGEVVIAVGANSTKNHLFTPTERLDLARQTVAHLQGVQVAPITGLLVDVARTYECDAIVRGLRFAGDFEYELQMAHINKHISGIESVFLPADPRWGTIASSMMREIAHHGGDISDFVTEDVNRAILAKVAAESDPD